MKKVILNNQQEDTIKVEDLNDLHIIGVQWENDNRKDQIVRIDTDQYVVTTPGESNMSAGNKYIYRSIQSLCYDTQIKEVFTFNNKKEFINWLLEE